MDDASIVSLLTGPFSSLLLLAGMGLGAVRFFSGTVVPAVSRWVDQHLTQNATMIAEHRADREAWLLQVKECADQGARIERKVNGLYKRLDSLQGQTVQ
jgi:ubiquinone biosynthesis protein UbiJ